MAIGTTLVRLMADIVLWLSITGGCAFYEHPQWATWLAGRKPPSIWITPWMRQLRRLRCCSVVSFDQCVFNIDIKKPTTLLLVRLRAVREAILQLGENGRCCHAGKHEALKGREIDGTFRTARGKVYPPNMNLLLGRAIIDFLFPQMWMRILSVNSSPPACILSLMIATRMTKWFNPITTVRA